MVRRYIAVAFLCRAGGARAIALVLRHPGINLDVRLTIGEPQGTLGHDMPTADGKHVVEITSRHTIILYSSRAAHLNSIKAELTAARSSHVCAMSPRCRRATAAAIVLPLRT